jgi:hypothetical protein
VTSDLCRPVVETTFIFLSTVMGASEELDYLKSLVSQLNAKITALECKQKAPTTPTPAQQLRTILVGPPGAGISFDCIARKYQI